MSPSFKLNPLGLAVCGALALTANASQAQVFDVNSPAVRQAYVGAATQEKKDSALAGLRALVDQVRSVSPPGGSVINPIGSVIISNTPGTLICCSVIVDNPVLLPLPLPLPPATTLRAASDSDLGIPGAAVTLNNNVLQTLTSFNTARNFTIGSDGATIDTNGFNFGISGNVNAIGVLTKDGAGTLTLTGNNLWNRAPVVANGVLEGNATSLRTNITNNATVRFNEPFFGDYSGGISTTAIGNFEKTGSGSLTLTSTQSYGGTTSILGGALVLRIFGSLGNTSGLSLGSGTMFDIGRSLIEHHSVGLLSGNGIVFLGRNTLIAGSTGNSTFAGSITDGIFEFGNFTKTGSGTLTLTGVNSYKGTTTISDGTLALSGQGMLAGISLVRINQGTFDISAADGAREVGTIDGNGNVKLGANTLTVGSNSVSGKFDGIISGSGGLNINHGGLTLTGTNTYTGVTTINQGALFARPQSISAIVINNGRLVLTEDGNGTYAGSISGTGRVAKSGAGTVTLTGINTYSGSTNIDEGTLALAGQGTLNAATAVTVKNSAFDISGAATNQEVGSISSSDGFSIGIGTINLGANTLTVGGNNTSQQFFGGITGAGGLTKIGSGDLTVTLIPLFAPTYTGVTTIHQGNLIATTQSISDHVVNNARLTLTESKDEFNPFVSAYSGNISGTGQLVKDGDGIIWLRGRNSYTGGTEVKSGILIGNTDSLQGNIVNYAALAFYQVDNGTYAGNLSGSGSLLQYGPGTLTLTGANTYTGGTAFSGTLRVDRDANLGAANGALVIAGGTLQIGADMTTGRTIVLSPVGGTIDTNGYKLSTDVTSRITGPGTLTKTGAGTLSLNGTDDPFAVAVQAGRLEVKNVVNTNNVAVAAGAELGGSGYIFGNISNSGRIARGERIGAINVEGHVSFDPGSVFLVKADAAGNSDRLLLTSHRAILNANAPATSNAPLPPRATLSGGTVDVRAETGNYRRETRYNILTADGGVTGQFTGVTSNLAFLDPSLSYDTNNVYLTLKRNDLSYTAVAQNANQTTIAQSLNRMANGGAGDAATVTAMLDGLSAPQARAAFDSIGGAGRALMPQSLNVNQRAVNQNLVARLGLADRGNSLAPATGIAGRGVQLAYEDSTRSDAAPVYAQLGLPAGQGFRSSQNDANNGLWLRAYGGSGRLDGDANAPGAKYHYGGTLLGYDHRFGNTTLGVFVGYAEPRYNQDAATSSAKAKTWQFGAYGRYASGAWHVDGVAGYARNDTDTSRVVSVGGLNRVAAGSFDGDALSAHLETGYTIKAGGFEVQPLAALSWVRQNQNAYAETGAGALNLILPDQSQESLRSSLGVRTLHPLTTSGMQWVFETRAAWSHEFKTTRSVNARLAGDPAAGAFTVSGPNVPRDSAVLGVGIAAQASKNLRFYADVNTELNGASRAYAVSAGLRYQW